MSTTTLAREARQGACRVPRPKHASERATFCHTPASPSRQVRPTNYDTRVGGSTFLEVDPVEGGSANDYDYADGDPVNEFDLAGTCSTKNKGAWGWVRNRRCNASNIAGGVKRLPTNAAGRVWSFAAEKVGGGRGRSCGNRTRCVSGSWLLVPWARAGTLGNTIVCRRTCDAATIRHEKVHVRQWQRGGVVFIGQYGWESMFGGYKCGNKYERPGYRAEGRC